MKIGWLSELQLDGSERKPPKFTAVYERRPYTFGPSPDCADWVESPSGQWEVGDTYCTIYVEDGKVST